MIAASLAVVALVAGVGSWYVVTEDDVDYRVEQHVITGADGVDGDEPVQLDATLYLPETASATDPAPAVLLAHGFGGTKHSVAETAGKLAAQGYAVLTWSARGFGESGGLIHLNHPEYEVADARRLVDWLAVREEIRRDADGDPRVGVMGA